MALLKPPSFNPAGLTDVLADAGVTSAAPKTLTATQQAFHDAGASIQDVARTAAEIMHNDEYGSTRLAAARFVSEVYNIIDKKVDISAAPQVNITILGNQNGLIGVLMPQSAPTEN
jgi:hypothetical protein